MSFSPHRFGVSGLMLDRSRRQANHLSKEAYLAMRDMSVEQCYEEVSSIPERSQRPNGPMKDEHQPNKVPPLLQISTNVTDVVSSEHQENSVSENRLKVPAIKLTNRSDEKPSEDIQVYIPLEKSYRAELRKLTERLGIKMQDNDKSQAARDFIKENPDAADAMIQERRLTQASFSISSNASEISRRMGGGKMEKTEHTESQSNKSRYLTTKKPQMSEPGKTMANPRILHGGFDRTKTFHGKPNEEKGFSTGIKVPNRMLNRPQTTKTAVSKRAPVATPLVPPVMNQNNEKTTREHSRKFLRRNSQLSTVVNVYRDKVNSAIIESPIGQPNYDVRYQINLEKPWIDEDPENPERSLCQELPSRETHNQSVQKCVDWFTRWNDPPLKSSFKFDSS